jgi:hypothetical protein
MRRRLVAETSGTFTFSGSSATLTVPFAAPLPAGNHVVTFTSTWPGQGSENGAFTQSVEDGPGPPASPTTPLPPPASVPPAPLLASAAASSAPVAQSKSSRVRRFRTKPVKKCRYGRRQLRGRGRRSFMRRTKPVPIAVRIPHFTG